jgi:hypothetical protein
MIIELEDYLKQFRSNSNLRDGSLLLDGQNNNVTILNHNNPNIAPTVVQQGGSDITQISFGGGGGGGKTDSVFQYGLPNSVA